MPSLRLQNALIPFAFTGTLIVALYRAVPQLRTPVPSALLLIMAVLLVLRPIQKDMRSSSRFRTRVLLIGNRPLAQKFMDAVEAHPKRRYTIVGVVEELASELEFSPWLVLGTIDDLQTIVSAVRPDRIVLALSERRGRFPAEQLLAFQAEGIVVEDVEGAYERITGKLAIEAVTAGQLIASQRLRISRVLTAAQRVFSFTAALILLVLLAPVLGLIALAIRMDSGGPVLFRQLRLGRKARPFPLIKFRTMRPSDNPASQWAQDNVSRITRIGRWLRRLRLDELPQLVNVIRGDMNLVGPRPHPVCNGELFRQSIPYYVLRCSVRPGVTGWAQTRYCYANNLEQETEKMRYDLYYIKHMSLWLDLRIIVDTCTLFLLSWVSQRSEQRTDIQPILTAKAPRLPVGRKRRPERAPAVVIPLVQYARDSGDAIVPAPEIADLPRLPIQPEVSP
jgi:exopolysaccharide biosynthesis polyprenyl glycosylphosphotransferase